MTDHKLDFVCVGPQRTATSWLHQYLKMHPGIALPNQVKETMFFDEFFDKGMDWYWNHFNTDTKGRLLGEIAPTYFDSSDARFRLSVFSGLRIIIIVRNPVERTYSLFRHHRSKGRVPDDYFAAVKQMPRIESSGRYELHCEAWEEDFGAGNCLYLLQPDVQKQPQLVFDRLCAFLGVEPMPLPTEAEQPFGAATRPPSVGVARSIARLSTSLRARGLHAPIEIAKSLGLRPLIFGKPAGEEPIPDVVASHLHMLHKPDMKYLEHKIGRRI